MLSDKLIIYHITCPPCPSIKYGGLDDWKLCWKDEQEPFYNRVLDTELLHLCWLVEETLSFEEQVEYQEKILCLFGRADGWRYLAIHATWQQRVVALCKVKGIVI